MRIGEMANLCGVSQRTLRYYEQLGLLSPRRSDRGVRLYSDLDAMRIKELLERLRMGESLGSIALAECSTKPARVMDVPEVNSEVQGSRKRRARHTPAKRSFKIGDIAKNLQTTVRTLRYYEEEGVIAPLRSKGGTRRYSQDDLEALRTALTLTRLGVGLETVKRLACGRQSCRTGDQASQVMSDILHEVKSVVTERLGLYAELEKDIDRASLLVRQCQGCNRVPNRKGCPKCPMERNSDQSKFVQLIWDRR
jgi:DNA-binding transcriptional MerR regulator